MLLDHVLLRVRSAGEASPCEHRPLSPPRPHTTESLAKGHARSNTTDTQETQTPGGERRPGKENKPKRKILEGRIDKTIVRGWGTAFRKRK